MQFFITWDNSAVIQTENIKTTRGAVLVGGDASGTGETIMVTFFKFHENIRGCVFLTRCSTNLSKNVVAQQINHSSHNTVISITYSQPWMLLSLYGYVACNCPPCCCGLRLAVPSSATSILSSKDGAKHRLRERGGGRTSMALSQKREWKGARSGG